MVTILPIPAADAPGLAGAACSSSCGGTAEGGRLPPAEEQRFRQAAERRMSFDGSKLQILVMGDNQHFRLLIRTVLQSLGVGCVEEAHDGADAWRRLRSFRADIVVADWKTEPTDGIIFAQRLRRGADSPNPFLPIIMITGYSAAAVMAQARDAGVNECLTKPLSAKGLVGRISSIILQPRPFVRSADYFGPDRRRRQQPFVGADRRHRSATLLTPWADGGSEGSAADERIQP